MVGLYHGKEKTMYTWVEPSITAILFINTPETIAHDAILLDWLIDQSTATFRGGKIQKTSLYLDMRGFQRTLQVVEIIL